MSVYTVSGNDCANLLMKSTMSCHEALQHGAQKVDLELRHGDLRACSSIDHK